MVFCFVQNFFFGQHKSQNIYFFCRAKREFFCQNLTLGYMTKTLNQIIFFFLHQNQNIFFSNIGNQNIFLEKKHNPPPPFKLNGRSLISLRGETLSHKTRVTSLHLIVPLPCQEESGRLYQCFPNFSSVPIHHYLQVVLFIKI